MKKIGELMSEMGFRKDGSESTKEAFLKHLIRAAENIHVSTPSERLEIKKNNIPRLQDSELTKRSIKPRENEDSLFGEQMSFEFLNDRDVS